MDNLRIKSVGPIKEANIKFGDLTLFVGPQASGKSILIQLLKLIVDKPHIRKTLEQYGYIWGKNPDKILDLYFGEGMYKIWKGNTVVELDGKIFHKSSLLSRRNKSDDALGLEEQLFYIPAQRILSVSDGRPKPFMEFDISVPYVLRQYSETLRQLLQGGIGEIDSIFPISKRLKEPIRKSFNDSIFHDGRIVMDEKSGQKKLRMQVEGMSVPFITWSAGQKEFMPLLLGFYWLCPPSKVSKKDDLKYVVIEEPEMGLHPQAIKSVMLQVMDLMSRGYQVIISTHSPVFLEFAWAFQFIKQSENSNYKQLMELFDFKSGPPSLTLMFKNMMKKNIASYYFDREKKKVVVKNISSLDAGSEDPSIAEWGGLSSFSSKASEIVLKSVPNE